VYTDVEFVQNHSRSWSSEHYRDNETRKAYHPSRYLDVTCATRQPQLPRSFLASSIAALALAPALTSGSDSKRLTGPARGLSRTTRRRRSSSSCPSQPTSRGGSHAGPEVGSTACSCRVGRTGGDEGVELGRDVPVGTDRGGRVEHRGVHGHHEAGVPGVESAHNDDDDDDSSDH
jgi:hypothetical protein